MPSLAVAGRYSMLSIVLFCLMAAAMQVAGNDSSFSRLQARDGWSQYGSALTDFVNHPSCSADGGGGGGGGGGSGTAGDLMIAVASYIPPLDDPDAWNRLIGYPNDKVPILCANSVNGPDYVANPAWQDVIHRAAAKGKIVLGYVRTGYLGVSDQAFKTRLGSGSLGDWTAQIEADVNMWYTLYGGDIGGIFFDEGWPGCGTGGSDTTYHDLYKYINDYTKRWHPGAYTVLNPGSPMDSCFEDTMDTLLTFELNSTMYINSYTPNDWTPKDSRKLWHIVYDTHSSQINDVAALARKRGAGFLQLTDDTLDNPYDNLPKEDYMQSQILQASGGTVLNSPASSWPVGEVALAPASLSISFVDYSSATLTWSESTGAFGYNVYVNGMPKLSLPKFLTSTTVGGLLSGQTTAFTVTAIGGGGQESPHSSQAVTGTKALPGGSTIINLKYSADASSSTFQADILVPYAFPRLFIWDLAGCDLTTHPGWPISYGTSGDYVCSQYMVEGEHLLKYSGVILPGKNAPWTWTQVMKLEPTVSGYTYTWKLPFGTDTFDPSRFVVQGQGYNAWTNELSPGNDVYDCKGSSYCGTSLGSICDLAAQKITRSDSYHYTNQGSAQDSGVCSPDPSVLNHACGIFIQDKSGQNKQCVITGNELYSAYRQLKGFAGCDACGSYHRPDGCLVTVNFVTGC